jgi:hypothetical protein
VLRLLKDRHLGLAVGDELRDVAHGQDAALLSGVLQACKHGLVSCEQELFSSHMRTLSAGINYGQGYGVAHCQDAALLGRILQAYRVRLVSCEQKLILFAHNDFLCEDQLRIGVWCLQLPGCCAGVKHCRHEDGLMTSLMLACKWAMSEERTLSKPL